MLNQDTIEVRRDVDALLIPSGAKIKIQKGSLVVVTQALGNSYTVYINGNLARLAGKDGDAINLLVLDELDLDNMEGTLEEKINETLKTCFDPEIPVNIVDLGLVYECLVIPDGKKSLVQIKMTLTAPGCGMGPVLVADIVEKLKQFKEISDVKVDLVFDPPWERSMMSDVAKLQLGMM